MLESDCLDMFGKLNWGGGGEVFKEVNSQSFLKERTQKGNFDINNTPETVQYNKNQFPEAFFKKKINIFTKLAKNESSFR